MKNEWQKTYTVSKFEQQQPTCEGVDWAIKIALASNTLGNYWNLAQRKFYDQ